MVLKGKATPGVMTMRSAAQTGRTGNQYYNEVTWTANDDGTVTQKWDVLDADGALLQVAFLVVRRRNIIRSARYLGGRRASLLLAIHVRSLRD